MGSFSNGIGGLIGRRNFSLSHTEERSYEDKARRQLSARQEEICHQTLTQLAP